MNKEWFRPLGLQNDVVQAGMGGGLSASRLATAVSLAGGLGTVGLMPPAEFLLELQKTRDACNQQPFAANLLMPFVRRAHIDACLETRPAVVSLFYGFDSSLVRKLQAAGISVWHQIGNREQAIRALKDGADALIAQGEEAGGHLAGDIALSELLPTIQEVAADKPVLAAGGIHDSASARKARQLGADGVVAGTRFLLTQESEAHPEYQKRLLNAGETIRTSLFGLAWPAPHRVVPNRATERWCRAGKDGPAWARWVNQIAVLTRQLIPMSSVIGLVKLQKVGIPLYSPAAATRDMDPASLDVTPLYAGKCVTDIHSICSAAEAVAELAQ